MAEAGAGRDVKTEAASAKQHQILLRDQSWKEIVMARVL